MGKPSRRPRSRRGTALDASLAGAGLDVAMPPLGRLSRQLQQADLGPSPEFRASLRGQLLSAATVATVAAPAPAAVRRREVTRRRSLAVSFPRVQPQVFARMAAGLAAGGVLIAGVGTASARALPGDLLYGVKRDTESVQLDLAGGEQAKGLLHLQFAATRLAEVHSLLSRAGVSTTAAKPDTTALPSGLAQTIQSTLTSMDNETTTGASELTTVFLQQRKTVSLTKLAAFATSQVSKLNAVLPALPVPAALTSLTVLRQVQSQTTVLLSSVPPPAATTPPPASTSASPSTSPTPTGSPTPTPTPTGSVSPSATDSATVVPTDSVEPSTGPSSSVSPSATETSPTATGSPTTIGTPAASTPTPTSTGSPTPVSTDSPTGTQSSSPRLSGNSPTPDASP